MIRIPKAVPQIIICHKRTKKEKEVAKTLISMEKIQKDIETNKFMQLVLAAKALEVPTPSEDCKAPSARVKIPIVTQESDSDDNHEEKMSELSASVTCCAVTKPNMKQQYPRSLSF